ncbi:phosphoglycerate dehydrogenase [Geminisphaera colitermitum]|uniref:phosphoglycerate dehydrogenase n=1 Tax=Geminisphaera colitermitum TaxID=1148786 RepID=UPI00019654E5|nr:phosphoglycerate dehydrogenase [Geminisphaera colitermitum]
MKVLITCPPMLRAIDSFRSIFDTRKIEITTPDVVQTLSEAELIELVPQFDGWIIGDDPATARVFEAGKAGRLKAAVKWGVGVDNVDFAACQRLGLPISNTPGMFGREVADVAVGYVIALARQTFAIDRTVKAGGWIKSAGISLAGKTVALAGFGDIGRNTARRLFAAEMKIVAYDPFFKAASGLEAVEPAVWPQRMEEADFIVITCALTKENRHMLGSDALARVKPGVRVVNVARGPLIDEAALAAALASGKVHSAALDVFEIEPLPADSPLRAFGDRCIFGSHNSSNTVDAVERTSLKAIDLMTRFFGVNAS